MGEEHADPTDEELIAFATRLLGGRDQGLAEPDLLRETISESRELWLLLYRASRGAEPSQPPPE